MKKHEGELEIFISDENCPIRDVLSRITDKWSMLILFSLRSGPRRFGEIKKVVDKISQRMLTSSLRRLECDGYVNRVVYPEIPPRVEYSLTSVGKSVMPPLLELVSWASTNQKSIRRSRKKNTKSGSKP